MYKELKTNVLLLEDVWCNSCISIVFNSFNSLILKHAKIAKVEFSNCFLIIIKATLHIVCHVQGIKVRFSLVSRSSNINSIPIEAFLMSFNISFFTSWTFSVEINSLTYKRRPGFVIVI